MNVAHEMTLEWVLLSVWAAIRSAVGAVQAMLARYAELDRRTARVAS